MFKQTQEIRAEVTGEYGRVRAWTSDKEDGVISIAVPADRATLTPADAKALGEWLVEQANAVEAAQGVRRTAHARRDVTHLGLKGSTVWGDPR